MKVKIKVLTNLGSNEFGLNALTEGIHEVDEPFAQNLIGRHLAERVIDEPEMTTAKAVAPRGAVVAESHATTVKAAEPKSAADSTPSEFASNPHPPAKGK